MAIAGSKKDMGMRLSKMEPIAESGCWIWLGSTDKDGYGRMRGSENGKIIFQFAHLANYEYYKGAFPKEKHIYHTCDIPCCITLIIFMLVTLQQMVLIR